MEPPGTIDDMGAVLLIAAIVIPLGLLTWLALTWPADAAADRLWRRSDDAWARGEHDTAGRYRRVADGLGTPNGLFRSSAVLAMGRLRRRERGSACDADGRPDPVDVDIATVWVTSSYTLAAWAVGALLVDAARHPRLVTHPAEWRARSTERVAALFVAHDATVVTHAAALTAMREHLDAAT